MSSPPALGSVIAVAATAVLLLLTVFASAGASAPPLFAGGSDGSAEVPSASVYSVTFTETGLVSGTPWTVWMNGTSQTTTNSSMGFLEPNGSYLFTVSTVPGYTYGPEGNVTVRGAPVNEPLEFVGNTAPPSSCTTFSWAGPNNMLFGNCIGFFQADYRVFNNTTGPTTDNTTFTLGPLAEVAPTGDVVALGTFGYQGSGMVTISSTSEEVNVTDAIVGNVTNAIGLNSSTGNPNGQTPLWVPTELPGGGGSTTWGLGNRVLGNISVGIVFHFANGSGTPTNRVEFDVTVSGWPWVSSNDVLGLAVEADAYALPGGSHFSYTASNDTIAQEWDSNNSTISSLAFGPTANVTSNPPSVLSVTDQVELSPTGPDPTTAGALLTFSGSGGYSKLVYDPWLFFGAHSVGSIVPPPVLSAGASASLPLVAIGGILAAAAVLGVLAYRVRRPPVDRHLASAG